MAKHNEIGDLGEKIAGEFLVSKGFKIIERNYWKPFGEIDLIVKRGPNGYRFIEVKSVSREIDEPSVPYETYRAEENVHPQKIRRLLRVIEEYLVSHGTVTQWQFDVIAVYIDTDKKVAKVRHLENIILGS